MNIQSLSVVVPNKECVNKCPFCVSRMVNSNQYPNLMDISHEHYDINVREYMKRMQYAADCGCHTLMLTGTSEPQQNKQFLVQFAMMHKMMGSPFKQIEMQTTGISLNDRNYLRLLRNFVGVNTMALSINSIDPYENWNLLGHHDKYSCNLSIEELCWKLRQYYFNIRMCFNLSDDMFKPVKSKKTTPDTLLQWAKASGASQVTFRTLYSSKNDTEQDRWINEHRLKLIDETLIRERLCAAPIIGHTMYGTAIHDIDGMSVIWDRDCMAKHPETDTLKYLILRPNCKLYSQWDSPASLVF